MRTYRKLHTALLLILSLALAGLLGMRPTPLHAATIVVNTVVDENDGSCADGDCSLRDAIATAAAGDTIVFHASLSGQTITLTRGMLQVWTSLTIDGSALAQHVKISGNHASRVFITLSPDGITLRELDIINGYVADGSGGSGIYNQRTLTLIGCLVSGNTTPHNGGGIRNTGTMVVEDSVVSHNQADYGGGIRNEGDLLIVRDSAISDNTANFGGGIDNYGYGMEMYNTTVERNTAVHYGGGITTGADALIEDSIFRDNTAEAGGGIDSHEDGVTLTLTRCTFTGNTAHLPAGYGGALNNDQAMVEVNDSTFVGNLADVSGGGIYNGYAGVMVVNGSAFTANTASSAAGGYGGAIGNSGTLALNRATFADNTAFINGGAVENWEGDLTVTGCTFTGNSAAAGGALNNNAGGTLTMADSTLRENTAEVGGGLFNDNDSAAEVTGSTFVGNSATADNGGGIENRGNSMLTIGNSTFSANWTVSNGGGIHNFYGLLTLTNVTLAGNSADVGGGLSIATAGTLNYRNTIIAGSPSGGDCNNDGTLAENVHNLVEDGSCSPLLSGDPQLGLLANNGGPTETHALLTGSLAIDAGDNAVCPPADQRGYRRPVNGGSGAEVCDIGAFEYNSSPLGVMLASFAAQPIGDHMLITWETVSEIETAGFNLYRDLSEFGSSRVLLGYTPAQAPGSPQGAAYSWVDAGVAAGRTYWYWLEDIDLAGRATLHGPVSATMPPPTAVVWSDFQATPMGGLATPAPWALACLGIGALRLWMQRRAGAAKQTLR